MWVPKILVTLRPRPLGTGAWLPQETRSCPTCVSKPYFVALGQTVWAQVREPEKSFWDAGVSPPWDRDVADLLTYFFPTCVTMSCHSSSNRTSVIMEIRKKTVTHRDHSMSLEPTLFDFLLAIHSNHGPISYRFQVIFAKFSHSLHLKPPIKGRLLEFCNDAGAQKIE